MRLIEGYLSEAPPPSNVHAADDFARRFHEDGSSPWSAPRSPEEDKSWGGMRSAREWWSCEYCGSMHPRELAAALRLGASVHWADFKYGWPHKLYVEHAPNRYEGHGEIRSGVTYCARPPKDEIEAGKWERYQSGFDQNTGEPTFSYRTPLPPPTPSAATTWGKFYTLHLQDASPEDRAIIERHSGLTFEFLPDGRVKWQKVQVA